MAIRKRDIICITGEEAADYTEYIGTQHWRNLRQLLYDDRGGICERCGCKVDRMGIPTPWNAHHKTYERLGYEKLSDLTLLCEVCHTRIEKKKKRRQRQEKQQAIKQNEKTHQRRKFQKVKKENAFIQYQNMNLRAWKSGYDDPFA